MLKTERIENNSKQFLKKKSRNRNAGSRNPKPCLRTRAISSLLHVAASDSTGRRGPGRDRVYAGWAGRPAPTRTPWSPFSPSGATQTFFSPASLSVALCRCVLFSLVIAAIACRRSPLSLLLCHFSRRYC